MLVVDAAARVAQRENLEGDERAVLLFAALCHDFAKPPTTKLREREGKMRWTSWGHEAEGGPMARGFLERIGIKPPSSTKWCRSSKTISPIRASAATPVREPCAAWPCARPRQHHPTGASDRSRPFRPPPLPKASRRRGPHPRNGARAGGPKSLSPRSSKAATCCRISTKARQTHRRSSRRRLRSPSRRRLFDPRGGPRLARQLHGSTRGSGQV